MARRTVAGASARKGDTERDDNLGPGLVESAVAETLNGVDEVHPAHLALVATALTLARKLDEGAGLATAAVARELRSTLDVLTKQEDSDDDDLHAFVSGLSSPLGNPAFS